MSNSPCTEHGAEAEAFSTNTLPLANNWTLNVLVGCLPDSNDKKENPSLQVEVSVRIVSTSLLLKLIEASTNIAIRSPLKLWETWFKLARKPALIFYSTGLANLACV